MTAAAQPTDIPHAQSLVTAPWWELTLTVKERGSEDVAAALIEAGATGVETRERPQSEDVTLIAAFPRDLTREGVHAAASLALAEVGAEPVEEIALPLERADKDWAHAWKQYFKPLKMGRRIWVVPSWEQTFLPPTGSLVIHLDPGMAFGTGQHATTSLCARVLEDWAEKVSMQAKRHARLLDVGTGSGILALVGAALGVGHADAIDNDPEAVLAAQQNIERNEQGTHIAASSWDLSQVPGTFDIVVANILAPTLEAMARELVRRVGPRGRLVLSGILAPQAEGVITAIRAALSREGRIYGPAVRLTHREWVAIVFDLLS